MPVGVTVTSGAAVVHVMLTVFALKETAGALTSATIVAVEAAAEQPLVPVATTLYTPGPDIVTVAVVPPLKIAPVPGAVQLYVVPPVEDADIVVEGVKQDKVNDEGVVLTAVGVAVLDTTVTASVPTQPLVVLVTVTLYVPPKLEVTVDKVFVPIIPGPDQL